MYEIEAKVRLSDEDVKRLRKILPKFAKKSHNSIKKDSYYGDIKTFYLRIRKKNKIGIINLKSKKVEQGIELNQEVELSLTSASKFHNFLKKNNIPLTAKKEKKSEVYKRGYIQIELNYIKKLGYFLEIEIIAKTKKDIPKAKKTLLSTFSELGFKSDQFEKRYYLELLV